LSAASRQARRASRGLAGGQLSRGAQGHARRQDVDRAIEPANPVRLGAIPSGRFPPVPNSVSGMTAQIQRLRERAGDSEKITINPGYVDLGHIDLLVQESFYSNRTDFIRTAIRNLL